LSHHRGYLGSGQVDFQGLFRGLAAISYSGPITFESFSSEVVSTELSNNLCVWRNMWSQSQLLARHARAFIEQQLISARVAALQEGASTPSVRQVRDDGSVLPAR
jgi:D-psicose/D-tagatose/L-ribulose 3-epimerase